MIYEVRFTAQPGSRRRAGIDFGIQPIFLEALPPAVARDPHLRVRELEALPTGCHLTPLSGDPPPADPPADLKPERVQKEGSGEGSGDPPPADPPADLKPERVQKASKKN